MGLGQTMITMLFFALLMVMFLNAIRSINTADSDLLTAEATKTAENLARSLMAEIQTKKFDKNADPSARQSSNSTSSFAQPWNLGPNYYSQPLEGFALPDTSTPFKSIQLYDDVDDYNGYTRLESAGGMTGFKDSVSVYYVDATQSPPRISTSSVTWYKQIEVWVTQSQYLRTGSNAPLWLKYSMFVTYMKKG